MNINYIHLTQVIEWLCGFADVSRTQQFCIKYDCMFRIISRIERLAFVCAILVCRMRNNMLQFFFFFIIIFVQIICIMNWFI